MFKLTLSALSAFTILTGSISALAETACAPEKLNAAIDAYAAEPFGARSWRVLQGLGDPQIEALNSGGYDFQSSDDWKKLVKDLAPDLTAVQDPGFECRMAYPLKVLKEHVQSLGKEQPYIKQWLAVQGVVITACGGKDAVGLTMPAPLADQPANVSAMQVDDRAYQEASIAFYRDKTAALAMFRNIGSSNSAHKAYARYNVANLLTNNKDVAGARTEAKAILADPSLASVHDITQELLGYVSNIEDTSAGWTALIDDTIAVLSKPKAEILASEKLKSDYARALTDISYAGIGAKQDDWWVKGELPENPTLSKAVMDEARKSPMALWMMAGQSVNSNYDRLSWGLVGDKWNGWSSSYIDRALALAPAGAGIKGLALDELQALKAKPDDASRAALWTKAKAAIQAANASCGETPETAAAAQLLTQAVRFSALANKFDEIYDGLANVPFKKSDFYLGRNTQGLMSKLTQFLLATGNVEEGRRLRDRLLTPEFFASVAPDQQANLKNQYSDFLALVAEDEAHWLAAIAMSSDPLASPLFNLLPVGKLENLASNAQFSAVQKSLLLRAAWTRDWARSRSISAARTKALLASDADASAAYEKVGKDYPKLSGQQRWLLTILRSPRFGILVNAVGSSFGQYGESDKLAFEDVDSYDHNDHNWWCPLEPGRQWHALRQTYDNQTAVDLAQQYHNKPLEPSYDPALAARLVEARDKLLKQHPMIKILNAQEIKSLSDMASAPRNLSQAAISWGKASKGIDGAAEALALAVRTTRYGCNWHGGHKAYSKPAQELLKSKFTTSDWTKKTPYWFDCMDNIWDKDSNKVASCKPHDWPKDTAPK